MRILRLFRISRRGSVLLTLSSVIFVYTVATGLMQYNLALFTDSIAQSFTVFGIIMGLPWLFSLLTDLAAGALAERLGKKRLIVIGLVGLGLSGLFFYWVSNLTQLFWVQVFFGTVEGFLTVAGMASVIAVSPPGEEHHYVGSYSSAYAAGYVVGPIAGGLATAFFGTRLPFLVFAALSFLAALIAQRFLPSPRHIHESIFQSLVSLVRKDRLYIAQLKEFFSSSELALSVSLFMVLAGMWSEFIWAMGPLYVSSVGLSPVWGGIIIAAFVVPFAFLEYFLGTWLDRTQYRFVAMCSGLALGGIGITIFGVFQDPVLLVLLATVASTGFALFYVAVNGVFDSISEGRRRGHMAGVWQSSEDIGFVIGPVMAGILADLIGLSHTFIFFGVLFLLCIFLVVAHRKTIRRYETTTAR